VREAGTRSLVWIGHEVSSRVSTVGQWTLMLVGSVARAWRRPLQLRNYLHQIVAVGVRSLPLAITMSLFAGMVLAFQFGFGLERFGAKNYIGQVTVVALFRELGPILTAIVVGGRVGSGISAELAGMTVNEQVDAVRVLGADPLQRLVAPRIFAVVVTLPLLTVCANLVGMLGGMLVASLQYGVSPHLFMRGVFDFVTVSDFTSGVAKSAVFGLIVGLGSCHAGLEATGGAEGVGRATTVSFVRGAVALLAADFVLTKLLVAL
jgi:phospholipid/cholesterol/gamma-HCH transport system permease protein